jgi:hypothetical protein
MNWMNVQVMVCLQAVILLRKTAKISISKDRLAPSRTRRAGATRQWMFEEQMVS